MASVSAPAAGPAGVGEGTSIATDGRLGVSPGVGKGLGVAPVDAQAADKAAAAAPTIAALHARITLVSVLSAVRDSFVAQGR